MISDRDIIRVHLSLEVPQAIAEILDRNEPMQDDELYALEVALSEMSPEKCILTMACAARYLALHRVLDEAMLVSLSLQADSAFDDYAPRYLAGLNRSMRPTCQGYPLYLEEDLGSFSELFLMVADILGTHTPIGQLCLLLGDQSLAHSEAIEFESDLFEFDQISDTYINNSSVSGFDVRMLPPIEPVIGGNVILFPVRARRT